MFLRRCGSNLGTLSRRLVKAPGVLVEPDSGRLMEQEVLTVRAEKFRGGGLLDEP